MKMENRNKIILAVGAFGALLASVGYYLSTRKSSNSEDEVDLAPSLTEEEAVKIMATIEDKFKFGYLQMTQYAQQIKTQYQQQGMMIDEKELNKALLPQAEKMFNDAEAQVYEVSIYYYSIN